jgi:hypothetical protein
MSSSNNLLKRVLRRVQKWWQLDPEFQPYLPEKHTEYRYPSPASQPDAIIPRQAFMKEFHIKYYQHDFRDQKSTQDIEHEPYKVIYRQDIIKNPMRLYPGQTIGPFHGHGMEKKSIFVFDERQNKQVYAHKKSLYPFRPDNIANTDEEEIEKMEREVTYGSIPRMQIPIVKPE